MFRFQILGLLRNREAVHGYALTKEYNKRTGRSYGAGYFYRQLNELQAAGLIRDVPTPPGMDRRRSLYEITDRGTDAFRSWFCAVERMDPGEGLDPCGRAIFFSEVEPEMRQAVVAQWRSALSTRAEILKRELGLLCDPHRDTDAIRPLLVRRDLERIQADLEFLRRLDTMIHPTRAPSKGVAEASHPAQLPSP